MLENIYPAITLSCGEIVPDKGTDHRILFINGKVAAVTERIPAHVLIEWRDNPASIDLAEW